MCERYSTRPTACRPTRQTPSCRRGTATCGWAATAAFCASTAPNSTISAPRAPLRRRGVRLRKRRLYRRALYEKEQLSEHTRFRGGTRRHHLRCLHLRRVPGPQRTSGALQQSVHNGRNRLCAGNRPLWPPVVRHEHGKVRGHAGQPCAGHAGRGAVLRRRQRDKLPDLGPREQHLSGAPTAQRWRRSRAAVRGWTARPL